MKWNEKSRATPTDLCADRASKTDESRGRPYLLHIEGHERDELCHHVSKPERLLESVTHPANLATALRNVARNLHAVQLVSGQLTLFDHEELIPKSRM